MNEREKSDRPVVPAKPSNNAARAAAEAVEGRGLREGNAVGRTRPGLRAGVSGPNALDRVRRIAQQDKGARFTALLHHVDVNRLRAAYWALNPKAATGVDGVTWWDYGLDLEETFAISMPVSIAAATGRSRHAGRTYRSRTGGKGRSGSPRLRTRSFSGRWSRY